MAWRLANSLVKLREQANEFAPMRKKSHDGTIGDTAHASRKSDHNPWVKDAGKGVVTALDLTHDPKAGFDSHMVAEYLRTQKDPRIKYVISNKRIFSSVTQPWTWRKYGGSNPHIAHMHVSVHSSKNHYDNERAWALPGKNVIAQTPPSPEVPEGADEPGTRPTLRLGATGDLVKIAQRLLHQRIDGTFGPLLEAATKGFQRGTNIDVDGIIGTDTWNELDELEQDNAPEHWHENITATVFGGKKDPNQSAYERRQITDLELGVALPFRFKGERPQVIVEHRTTGKQAICEIVDVGPWNTDDPYWVNKARPQAESGTDKRGRKTNKAGIDLTPGAAKAIGLGGLGQVNWSFVGTQDEGEPS